MTHFEQRVRTSFGNRLYEMRMEKELTQLELATGTGFSRPTIQAMEVGRQNVTLVQIFQLAEALGCEPLDLWPR